jgi:hypothetical integral membrane protein (TIGR02206 family)
MFFSRWGLLHLSMLAAVGTVAAVSALLLRREAGRWRVPRAAGVFLALNELGWYLYCVHQGIARGIWDLPLHLCDITLWLAVYLLLRPAPAVYDVAYYWALAGTSAALLMPDVRPAALSYPILHFFAGHGLVVAAVLGLAWGKVYRPRPRSWMRAWLFLNAYTAFVALLNAVSGANYMYLARKPSQASLLDYFGPWPWYILAADLLALGLFAALYLPWQKTRKV